MFKKHTALKAAAVFAAGLLLFSCDKTQQVTELSVNEKAANFEAAGGDKSITVTSNADWTVSCPADWVTVTPKAGSGNGSIKISVTANEAFDVRSTDITVTAGDKTQTIKVSQLSLSPSLLIDPASTEVPAEGGEVELSITSNAPWTLTIPEGVDWISADPMEGSGSATVKVTVLQNVEREGRTAKITVKETVNGSSQELTVTQELGPLSRYSDSLALVAVYNASDGANWKEERRWDLTKSMDTWDGVKLAEGRVTSLSITAKDVIPGTWTLPKEIGELTELTVLKINQNKLTGELPEELFNLTKLTDLYFQSNDLTGRFSDKYTNLVNLKNLYINNNLKLEGSLPASIGQLTQLESINIAQTSFSGTIPQELSLCTALKNIMAWKNNLSGEIPDFWDKLPNVGVIQFYGNPDITGPIPPTMGTLKKATGIQLKECNLTGNIPASFGGLEKCSNLQLNGNKLEGIVPAEVQAHPKWEATTGWKYEINILPQQEGYILRLEPDYRQLDSLVLVKIYTVADGANWKDSRKWKLEEPMDTWPGIKLNEVGRVIEVSITNGTVSTVDWELPAEIADLTELSVFQAVGSRVVGSFPEFLYSLTKLTKLVINGNKITGSLSDQVANWTELTNLYVNNNKELGGTLPAALGSLKKLINLNIAQTAIGGALPAELSGCESLQNFMAYETAFTSIPDNWDQWPALKTIQLYGCKSLECPLPASIGNMKNVTSLQLKNGNYTGNIPESYANLPATCKQLFVNGNKLQGVVPAAVKAHPNWASWKPASNILPQQDGYGLTE